MSDYLTPLQVADKLQLSYGAVSRALREGRLPGYRVLGRWRISCAELESWIGSDHSRSPESDDFLAEVRRVREHEHSPREERQVGSSLPTRW